MTSDDKVKHFGPAWVEKYPGPEWVEKQGKDGSGFFAHYGTTGFGDPLIVDYFSPDAENQISSTTRDEAVAECHKISDALLAWEKKKERARREAHSIEKCNRDLKGLVANPYAGPEDSCINDERLRALSRIALGGLKGNKKEEVVRAWRFWRNEVTPEVVIDLVDRIEQQAERIREFKRLADRIGERSRDYMDDGYASEAETLGIVEGEIRATLQLKKGYK